VNPHRPRKPRKDGAALRYLDEWREYVAYIERPIPADDGHASWCPGCLPSRYSRDRLESLMHNGGRRAHELRVAVAELDDRFRNVTTVERDALQSEPWWHRRDALH
jgi:hypothetical protein